jgi:ABC-type lipoprotein release transport system permease subunit
LTVFVIILSLLISTIILRRYITTNRVEIGIMQANGVHKYKIAISLTPFALLPAAAGGISGYLAGTLLQGPAIGLFKSY